MKTTEKLNLDWKRITTVTRTKNGAVDIFHCPSAELPYCVRHRGENRFFEARHGAYTYCVQQGWLDLLSVRKKRLLDWFQAQNRPYGATIIDGEPVVYRREDSFDVEISQGRHSPFRIYIWSLGESGYPQGIVRRQEVQSRNIPAAAHEIDRFVENYMSEVANAV